MSVVPHLAAKEPISEIAAALREHGVAIVDEFLGARTLDAFNRDLEPHLDAFDSDRELVNPLVGWFMGPATRHFTGVAAKSRIFADEILCHPVLGGLCDEILLPSCASYQLNIAHVLERGPGSPQQLPHRDEIVWCHLPRPHPEVQVASVIALVDFTADNGATRIIPGSHRWPLDREPKEEELVVAEMPAGSAVVYLGSTIHAGGPNTSEVRRRAMHLSYTLGWLRTEENHYLSTPIDVARTLSPRAQELLGYAAHDAVQSGGGYLGTVDACDPRQLMAEGRL